MRVLLHLYLRCYLLFFLTVFCGTLWNGNVFGQSQSFSIPWEYYLEEKSGEMAGSDTCLDSDDITYRGASRFGRVTGGRLWGLFYRLEPRFRGNNFYFTEPSAYGAFIGYDRIYNKNTTFNVFYHYGYYNLRAADWFETKTTNHLIGIKYRKLLSHFYFLLEGSGGLDAYKYENTTFGESLTDGYQARGLVECGMSFPYGSFKLKPFVSYQYDWLWRDSLNDTFQQNLPFGDSLTLQTSRGILGTRVDYSLKGLTVEGRLGWIHAFDDTTDRVRSRPLSSMPGIVTASQLFYGSNHGCDWVWGGIGLKYTFFGKSLLFFDYDLMYNTKEVCHIGSAGLCLTW